MIKLNELKSLYQTNVKQRLLLDKKLKESLHKDLERKRIKQYSFIVKDLEERLLFQATRDKCLIVAWFPSSSDENLLGNMVNHRLNSMLKRFIQEQNGKSVRLSSVYVDELQGNSGRVFKYLKDIGLKPVLFGSRSSACMDLQRKAFEEYQPNNSTTQTDAFEPDEPFKVANIIKPKKSMLMKKKVKPAQKASDVPHIYGLEIVIEWG